MRRVLFMLAALILFTCEAEPLFAKDGIALFDYFLRPIPAPSAAMLDTVKVFKTNGIFVLKPTLTISAVTFNRDGEPIPFSAAGMGISFQREINVSFENKVTFQVDLSYVILQDYEYGPMLTIGAFDGLIAGGAYGIKTKHFYALFGYSFTLFKKE
jgi:hypothetical protein